MLILGILSIFQILLLPGIIFLKLINIKTTNFFHTFLYSMGFSLYINYILVCILTTLKLYIPVTVYSIFFIEVIIVFIFYFKKKINLPLNFLYKDYFLKFKNYFNNLSSLHKYLAFTSISLLLFFISLIFINSGTIIYFTDALTRNNWIKNWAANTFPLNSGHYPQLLPANMSLSYVFVQNNLIEFFQKSIMPFFFIGILLIFFDLSLKEKPILHLSSFIIYSIILLVFYSIIFITSANADIPTAFFGFLVFYVIKKNDINIIDWKIVITIVIFATSSINTKLAGIFILGISLLWIAYYIFINKDQLKLKELSKGIIIVILLMAASFFWYIVKPNMRQGLGESPFMTTSTIYEKIIHSVNLLYFSFGPVLAIFLLLTIILALFEKESRIILIFIISPVIILWTFLYNYDYRNLSIIMPFIAYCSSFGLKFLYNKIINHSTKKTEKNENEKNHLKAKNGNRVSKNIYLRPIILLIVLLFFFFVVNSNLFFNLLIVIAYFLHKFYFNYFRVVFTTDIGYYKYVTYYVQTFKMILIIIAAFYFLKFIRIKLWHIISMSIIVVVTLNFTFLTKENLHKIQKHEKEMVEMRNLYYNVYPFISKSKKEVEVLSNYRMFCELIPPLKTKFTCNKIITEDTFETRKVDYFLLNKKYLKNDLKFINQKINSKRLSLKLDNGQFLFLENIKD